VVLKLVEVIKTHHSLKNSKTSASGMQKVPHENIGETKGVLQAMVNDDN